MQIFIHLAWTVEGNIYMWFATGKTDIFELTKISDRLNLMFSNSILFMIAAVKTFGSFSISQKLFTHCTTV